MRNPRAQRVELVGSLEKLHDLLQLTFFFIRTGHIGKCGFALAFLLILDLGTAHIHNTTAGAAAVHGHEQHSHTTDHDHIENDLKPWNTGFRLGEVIHHGSVRVGLVVLLHIVMDKAGKIVGLGNLVGGMACAAVGGQQPALCGAADAAQQSPLRQLLQFLLRSAAVRIRERQFPFLQPQFQHTGVAVQQKGSDLIGPEIPFDLGIKILSRRG